MSKTYPYLEDSNFLLTFDNQKLKEEYVKITLLTYQEKTVRAIEGRAISGTINLSGSSTIRRTCSLTMIADQYKNDLTDITNLISINKKLQLEIGFLNTTSYYQEYKTIWFPLGIYVITDPSLTFSSNGVTISLQLKDKMALLNGECGGVLPAAVTFSEYDTINENGAYVTLYPTLYQIIQEVVNHFGGEQLSKIIISDIDTRIKKVEKWTGNTPLYRIAIDKVNNSYEYTTDITEVAKYDSSLIQEFIYGDDVGYIYTDFIYTGELVGEAGDSVCTILDKIVTYLGNYEYFYDLEGNFIFQEIKNYLNTSQATVELEKLTQDDYLIDMSRGKAVYVFDDSKLITAYTNSPQYSNIKNDFIVWGSRENANGNQVAIRYHLAIDNKPQLDDEYEVFFYTDPNDNLRKAKCPIKFNNINQFPLIGMEEVFYLDASTGKIFKWDPSAVAYDEINDVQLQTIKATDYRTALYLAGTCAEPFGQDSNYYYTELANEWPKIYDLDGSTTDDGEPGFFPEVLSRPYDIDYFLDFIDSGAAVSEINISNIGRRTKVIVDDDVNCIFEPDIPNIVLLNNGIDSEEQKQLREECDNQNQTYCQVDSAIYAKLAGGGAHNSAYEYVRDLLYQYTSYNESIVVTALPIYYLEPNTRITVRNSKVGIYGDYIINNITLPLSVSGTMTLSCVRALERI